MIPERTVHFILERNPKLREVLEERIRYSDRELERQKRIEQRRKLPLTLDLHTKPEFGEKVIKRVVDDPMPDNRRASVPPTSRPAPPSPAGGLGPAPQPG